MITMKRVDKFHALVLDIKTDKSHLVKVRDFSQVPILTFNSDTFCFDSNGKQVARITLVDKNWTVTTELPLDVKPVPFEVVNSIFNIEAEFCKQWLELQNAQ